MTTEPAKPQDEPPLPRVLSYQGTRFDKYVLPVIALVMAGVYFAYRAMGLDDIAFLMPLAMLVVTAVVATSRFRSKRVTAFRDGIMVEGVRASEFIPYSDIRKLFEFPPPVSNPAVRIYLKRRTRFGRSFIFWAATPRFGMESDETTFLRARMEESRAGADAGE